MNGKEFGEKKLYVNYAQSAFERKTEAMKQNFRLMQSKKRCTLVVRGFPDNWKEE
jgi:hypothetical protein